jgi:hypothetical protein
MGVLYTSGIESGSSEVRQHLISRAVHAGGSSKQRSMHGSVY